VVQGRDPGLDIRPGDNPGANLKSISRGNRWFLKSTPIQMPPESGGICGICPWVASREVMEYKCIQLHAALQLYSRSRPRGSRPPPAVFMCVGHARVLGCVRNPRVVSLFWTHTAWSCPWTCALQQHRVPAIVPRPPADVTGAASGRLRLRPCNLIEKGFQFKSLMHGSLLHKCFNITCKHHAV